MLEIKVRCEGISPILMNRVPDGLLDQLRGGVKVPKAKDKPEKQEAEEKLYKEKGKVGIPATMMFGCLKYAGRFVLLGPRQRISTMESTLLPSFLTLREMFLPFNNGAKWDVDKRAGRSAQTDAMVCLVRPRFDKWGFDMTLEVEESIASPETVKSLVEKAGSVAGLGDFRPGKGGPFGRFKVAGWKVTNGKKPKKGSSG